MDISETLEKHKIKCPHIHIVLGSSFSGIFSPQLFTERWTVKAGITFEEMGLQHSTAPGHKGVFYYLENKLNRQIATIQVGRLHGYEGLSAQEVVKPTLLHRKLGTKKFILTNAAGALTADFHVGSVMLVKDHVNLTGMNPLVGSNTQSFPNGEPLGPRFPDMKNAYDTEMTQVLSRHLKKRELQVHEGTYLGLLGPSFETPAEIKLFSKWGLQAVGMSTVLETISLRHSGARVAALSLISNLGCGLGNQETLNHSEILENCKGASEKILRALLDFIENESLCDE